MTQQPRPPITPSFRRFRAACDALSVHYILDALRENGLHLAVGEKVPGDLCTLLNLPRKHQRLVLRLSRILEEDGIFAPEGADWIVQRLPPRLNTQEELQKLRDSYPEVGAELDLFARASYLGGVLKGARSGLEILFPDGSFALADQLYRETIHARVMNPIVAQIVLKTISYFSPDRKIRILEIGAGTGSTTRQILPLLPPERVEYFFTDVSKLFLARAEKQFSDFAFVRYELLDLEATSPLSPAVLAQGFDLIIAANVVHATKSLREALASIRKMLCPGGFLLLLEASRTERLADITLGSIDGWWRFEDQDLRQNSALVAPALWIKLLLEQGLTSALLPPEPRLAGIPDDEPAILARYNPTQDAPSTLQTPNAAERTAILLAGDGDNGRHFASQLRLNAIAVTNISVPDPFNGESPSQSSTLRSTVVAAIDQASSLGATTIDLIWLVPSAPQPTASDSSRVAMYAQEIAAQALSLVQDLLRNSQSIAAVWLVTSASQTHEQTPSRLSTSVLTGLVRVLASEHPSVNWHILESDPRAPERSGAAIARAIAGGAIRSEVEVTVHEFSWAAPRLQPLTLSFGTAPKIEPSGAYLITGAFGTLGLVLVRWLAKHRAGTLYLLGKSHPGSAAASALSDIADTGTTIVTVIGDVTVEGDVQRVFNQIAQSGKPLRGIFHAAAILDDATVLTLSSAALNRVLAPKVAGSWLLHQHSVPLNLDHFVLFSSAAAVLGSPGQANYAMGNAFLGALAHYRHAINLPATTIDWGPWVSSGTHHKRDFVDDWAGQGGAFISESQGFTLLDAVVLAGLPQVVVLPIPRSILAASLPARSILRDLPSDTELVHAVPADLKVQLHRDLQRAPTDQRPDVILAYIQGRLVELLGLDDDTSIADDTSFVQLGLDSLMSLEIKNELENALSLTLPHTIFFDYPDLRSLRQYVTLVVLQEQSRAQSAVSYEESTDREEIRI